MEQTVNTSELLSEFVRVRTYARWLPEFKRRETWEETVSRYMNWITKDISLLTINADQRNILKQAILSKEIMPSMRAIWTAGEAADKDNIGIYNCFAGHERFITKEYGSVSFQEVVGREVTVQNKDAEWVPATVREYGSQKLTILTLYNQKSRYNIVTTANHNWHTVDGNVLHTNQLKEGMQLPYITSKVRSSVNVDDLDYSLGVVHGLVYGDGTTLKSFDRGKAISQKRNNGYMIRLCGENVELLKYFKDCKVSYPPSFNGEPVVFVCNSFAKTHSLKELPDTEETDEYLTGFFRGWFAADGYIGKSNNQASLACDPIGEDFLRNVLAKLGLVFGETYVFPNTTNYGERKSATRKVPLLARCLVEEDFLLSYKKSRFKKISTNPHYTVLNVTESDIEDNVFCVEVDDDTHTFTLDNGILTGNCSYMAITSIQDYKELLYILMNGTGVGFSVEKKYINQLPIIQEKPNFAPKHFIVKDSKEGWANSLADVLQAEFMGYTYTVDYSGIRPKGSKLRTFGGRASGPEPLMDLFNWLHLLFDRKRASNEKKLSSLEAHDICCQIAAIVVAGGVRRSSLISLSNLDDTLLRDAKTKENFEANTWRAMANNSAVYDDIPTVKEFNDEWKILAESGSGERGIFNKRSVRSHIPERRTFIDTMGTNPCSEILLRNHGVCNLSEVVLRTTDGPGSFLRKIQLATILGVLQSLKTDFPFLREEWSRNAQEERLLGVSITGQYDNIGLSQNENLLQKAKELSISTASLWSNVLGINMPAAITCVKPSGTVSPFVDASSGAHPRYDSHLIRRVRINADDPIVQLMESKGADVEPCIYSKNSKVVSFPLESPKGSITRHMVTAADQLDHYLNLQENWTEHNTSMTVYVRENEWESLGKKVYENFDKITGVSFLPEENFYEQAPWESITESKYSELLSKVKGVDFTELTNFEYEDETIGDLELACSAGGCELK